MECGSSAGSGSGCGATGRGIETARTARTLAHQQQQYQHLQQQPELDDEVELQLALANADIDKSPVSVCSMASSTTPTTSSTSTSTSTSTSSTASSEPQYSEDMRRGGSGCRSGSGGSGGSGRPMLDLLPRQGSGSSTKTCEVDLGDEERDTFSPVSTSTSVSPSGAECVGAVGIAVAATVPTTVCNGSAAGTAVSVTFDNKVYDGTLTPLKLHKSGSAVNSGIGVSVGTGAGGSGNGSGLHTATKEEKQRQNEEIVIMETSSISSETGSWESVFPHVSPAAIGAPGAVSAAANLSPLTSVAANATGAVDLRNCCTEFLQNERKIDQQVVLEKPKEKDKDTNTHTHTSKDRGDHHVRGEYQLGLFKESNISPYLRERTYSTGGTLTADTSSLFAGSVGAGTTSPLLRDLDKCENALTNSGTSACFIDASSLRDEDEVLSFPSLDGQQSNDDLIDAQEREAAIDADALNELSAELHVDELDADVRREEQPVAAKRNDDSPTKKLETFHKAFAKCKVKSKDLPEFMTSVKSSSSSSSNSGIESPQKGISVASATSTNNLSDEEKLWKREHATQKAPATGDVKDLHQHLISGQEDATEASVSLAADVDSSDSSEIVKLRRVQERKSAGGINGGASGGVGAGGAGTAPGYVFHHSIQQFSIHPLAVSPKFNVSHGAPAGPATTLPNTVHAAAAAAAAAHSDLSYTTDYSSSSPAPSLVWSEHEHRPSVSAGRQHADDFDAGHTQKPSLLPETPHNSIAHIDNASSNTSSIHRDYTLSSSFSHQRDSGAYCSDATDSPVPMPRTPKRSKFDEANPIVSGGVSVKDFDIKKCESPPVKRKTDTCPIVSGGFISLDFEPTRPVGEDDDDDENKVEMRPKPKTRKPIPGIASWVVDMSDCHPERRKSTSSTSSLETPAGKFRERSDSNSSHKSGCGFYVSLDDMDKKNDDLNAKQQVKQPQMSKSYTAPKASGYFVNLSKSEYKPKEASDNTKRPEPEEDAGGSDKKNIFSMFIDFGEKKAGANGAKKEPFSLAQRLSTSAQRRTEDAMKSSASSTETLMSKSSNFKTMLDNETGESKSLDYKCNMEPPITVAAIRRISQQQRSQNADASKRHSWSNNQQSKDIQSHDYKRSISLTANNDSKDIGGNGLMSIIDKLPIISKASSLSVDSSLSPYDEYTGSKSELSTCSNNSARNSMSGGERDENPNNPAAGKLKKRRRDVQINETFDKSSLASITDGVLSKDLSPASTTDTDDLTFQQDEELAIREAALQHQHQQHQQQQQQHQGPVAVPVPAPAQIPIPIPIPQIPSNRSSAIIMETIIETKETSSPKKNASGHTMETLHATIEKQKMLLETVNEHIEVEKCSFVKLSDMDKPVKFELHSPDTMMSKSVGNHRQINRLFRDESKMRPHSWTMTRSTGNSFLNITNSVDNLRSLSRLFPNFSKEFSNSVPNDMVLDHMDYIQTDISADSSLASSFSRSGMDESSLSCRQPRRLGEDLLKMFLQELATDMIVEVHGRRIKAHKCILRSRCQYFAAMLAGSGSQSVVSLQGYSYPAVHFALCHIYSGASHPPDGISLMELAALADLLGLEGLKEVTAHALRTNYCHNFHKPCSGCIDGILQVLPVALNHALDDLYRKCLRWSCRHYLKVWPTRQFAQLPPDIHGRCRQQIVAYLTSESVLDTVLDCDNMLGQLSAYRWGGVCENLVRNILDAAYGYVADHFASLIASDSFLLLGHDRSCHIPRLEGILLRTASSLTPDQACRSYQRVTRLNTVLQAKIIQMPANLGELAKELQGLQEEELDWDPEYIRLVSAILSAVEQCLIRQCSRAMRVTAWQRMDLDLRKKIQTLARLTEPLDLKRSKPVSKAFTFSGSTRNQDLYQVKLAIQAHSKRALAQDTQLYKSTQTQETGNVQTVERGVQANNDLREGTSKLMKSNSRAYVPQAHHRTASQSAAVSERNSINTHRRTQSEVPVATIKNPPTQVQAAVKLIDTAKQEASASATKQKIVPRLADVRPRYLEPRKVHNGAPGVVNGTAVGPVRSATSSSIPATRGKGHHISSSESSRNSSPAARKNTAKIGTKSTNMSLDSLASPSRRTGKGARGKSSDNERFSDVCGDSISGSMKSSMITNKTVSHESLTCTNKLSRSNPLIGNNNNRLGAQRQSHSLTKANGNAKPKRGGSVGTKPPKHLQQQHIKSTGSSPSSVNTTKSATSRLSSVSSTHSSRDLFKHRSISVPVGQQDTTPTTAGTGTGAGTGSQRFSFLSAKSREILARRAEKNKQQQLQANSGVGGDRPTTGPMRSASHTTVAAAMAAGAAANRNSLPSNIPTRRPNTLLLKKTNGFNKVNATTHAHEQAPPQAQAQAHGPHSRIKVANVTNGVLKAAHAVRQKFELLIDNTTAAAATADADMLLVQQHHQHQSPVCVESKLERSSTFCKDSSDMDMNELQIIE